MWKVSGIKIECEPEAFFCGRTRKSVKNGNLYFAARYSETKKDIGIFHKRSNDGYALCIGDQVPFGKKWLQGSFDCVLVARSRVSATKCDPLAKI